MRPAVKLDHSSPSSAEVKELVELYLHSPDTPSWRGAQLKHRDNFGKIIIMITLLPSGVKTMGHILKLENIKFHVVLKSIHVSCRLTMCHAWHKCHTLSTTTRLALHQ
jgi:hypothetical protein